MAGIGFLWFLSHLRSILEGDTGDRHRTSALAFGAGAVAVGLMWVWKPVDVGIAFRVGCNVDQSYQALRDISHWHFVYSQAAMAVALGALCLAARRASVLSPWVLGLTAVTALTSLLFPLATPIVLLLPDLDGRRVNQHGSQPSRSTELTNA